MAMKQGVIVVTLVWETEERNFPRSKAHIPNRLTEALDKIQNVIMDAEFVDENGSRLRRVEFGEEGSPELKRLAEIELGTDEVVA